MPLFPIVILPLALATASQAQVADRLSRGIAPNAIDRSLPAPVSGNLDTRTELDRQRSDQAARDTTSRLGPPPTSTTVDGPSGVQRIGGGVPSSPTTPPATVAPQP